MFRCALLRPSVCLSFRTAVSAISKHRFCSDCNITASSSISSSSSSCGSSPHRRSERRRALRDFKDRLRPLGPGRVNLSLNDSSGLATLVLDNHDIRNGETHTLIWRWAGRCTAAGFSDSRTINEHATCVSLFSFVRQYHTCSAKDLGLFVRPTTNSSTEARHYRYSYIYRSTAVQRIIIVSNNRFLSHNCCRTEGSHNFRSLGYTIGFCNCRANCCLSPAKFCLKKKTKNQLSPAK